jgi:NADH dehydrogenase [ubiquinone] 1 alpha subcomplex assembly factor 5
MRSLSRSPARRTSATVRNELFDNRIRALRRDRAFRAGDLFLHERAFSDILERLALINRRFAKCLLIGCPDADWVDRLRSAADEVEAVDPGPQFALAAGGACVIEDSMELPPACYDLCVAVGTLDSVNDLPAALRTIRAALKPDSLFIGVMGGGNMLPQLRAAMRAADQESGVATPHVHPRIEAPALATLLSAAGFAMPVVDVDRVQVAYSSFGDLVRDLRGMGATNILRERSGKPLSRRALAAATAQFESSSRDGKTVEQFDLLHFAAWTPASEEWRRLD